MEIRIQELLNGYEDSSVPMEETDVVSAMRIKELTEMKIEQTETQYMKKPTACGTSAGETTISRA